MSPFIFKVPFIQPIADSNTILLVQSLDAADGSTTFVDNSNVGHSMSVLSAAVAHSTTVAKFDTSSMYFNSGSIFPTVVSAPDWDFEVQDFTVDFWIYVPSVWASNGTEWILSNFDHAIGDRSGTQFRISRTNMDLFGMFYNGATSSSVAAVLGLTLPSVNTWHHVAFVRSGSNLLGFMNGVLLNTKPVIGTVNTRNRDYLIGSAWYNSIPYNDLQLRSYLEEFHVSSNVARWTSDFTVATSSYVVV